MVYMRIHHIGYLVRNIEKAKEVFEELGYRTERPVLTDGYRQILVCFLIRDGYRIELVSPLTRESVVANLLKRTGGGYCVPCLL